MDKALAGGIVGAYGGSVYLSTILGAWLADRIWGAERTLFIAGIVVMTGHILLAIVPGLMGLLLGLVFIALGSGGVKSSAGSMVGSLYEREDLRELRDAGFLYFLYFHQYRRLLRPVVDRYFARQDGFPLRFRRGGRRHGIRPVVVFARP